MSRGEIDALLRDYEVKLDEQSESERKVLGFGAYGTVINVKVNSAPCVAKRVHDILLGTQGYEPVSIDQWLPMMRKFGEECKLLSKMRHPNVVQFIGVCELAPGEPRSLALVMERLHTDLRKYIDEAKVEIPLPVKLRILHDTSSGLLYLHSQNVVHRDLNAGNVLLTENLRAKVADLGVARVITMSSKRFSGQLTRTPGCMDYMPPEALQQVPQYGKKLDCFSFGHLMLYLIIQHDPTPYPLTQDSLRPPDSVGFEILKRQQWIDEIDPGHCLLELVTGCLKDKAHRRPEMKEINEVLDSLCQIHPQTTAQSQRFNQLLEQLSEMKQTASKLTTEPLEMVNLLQHVINLEDQNNREAELIRQAKDQVQFSEELLKGRSEQMESLSSQMSMLEMHLREQLSQMDSHDADGTRCAQLEEQIQQLQEEIATKDSELQNARTDLQRFRDECEQRDEANLKRISDLSEALEKSERDFSAQREEKNVELAGQRAQIHSLQEQNSELQTIISGLRREAEIKRTSPLGEASNQPLQVDQASASKPQQEQSNPTAAENRPVPRRRTNTMTFGRGLSSNTEDTRQYAFTLDRSHVFRRPKPTSEEGGSERQAALVGRQRPVSYIENIGVITGADDELARKLFRRQLLNQVEPDEASQEEVQPDQPKDESHMANVNAELRQKLLRRRDRSESTIG